ncbi:MAG: hypothetical protein ACI4F9_10325 [Lachnospiraceae bacterium]
MKFIVNPKKVINMVSGCDGRCSGNCIGKCGSLGSCFCPLK